MWKSVGYWIYKQRWLWLMLVLSGITVYLGINSSEFRRTFLFDRYGEFQWIGVSAIFAGVGLFLSANSKNQEIKANIFAKNELEILQSFRKDCSEFSTLLWEYETLFREFDNKLTDGFKNEFEKQKIIKDLNELFKKIEFKKNYIMQDAAIYKNNKKFDFFTSSFSVLNVYLEESIFYLNQEMYKNQKNPYIRQFSELNNKFINYSSDYIALVYNKQLRNLGQK